MKEYTIRLLGGIWLLTSGNPRDLEYVKKDAQSLVDFCNKENIRVINKSALTDAFSSQLKY